MTGIRRHTLPWKRAGLAALVVVALAAAYAVREIARPPVVATLVAPSQGFAQASGGATLTTRQAAFAATVRVSDGAFALSGEGAEPPSSMQLTTVTIERGAIALSFPAADALPDGQGGAVIPRGPVLERLQVLDQGLELSWTFPAEPDGDGDALVEMRLSGVDVRRSSATATVVRSRESGLDVRVGAARWVDASGKATPVAQELRGDLLTFRVPAAVLRASSYPAVLDPVVSPASIGQVAFDAGVADGTINTLTVKVSGTGSVASSDGAIQCGTACAASYTSDSTVTLTATPGADAKFWGWSGPCAGTGACTVSMSKSRTAYAVFQPLYWPVKVYKVGGGAGTATGSGIDCPASSSVCTLLVPNVSPARTVSFSPAAQVGSVFTGWSADCGGTGDCTMVIDRAKYGYATFVKAIFTVQVQVRGVDGSTVVGSNGFTCAAPSTCSFTVPYANPAPQVSMQASPPTDFVSFSGACGSGYQPSCLLTVDGDKFVYATFQSKTAGTIGYYDAATGAGGHFDATAEAWSENGGSCVRCHTTGGFQDYVGLDGKPNYLQGTFLTNTTTQTAGPLSCYACHNATSDPLAGVLGSVVFPSLARVDGLDGATALCSQCHQGRESTPSVNSKITTNLATAAARGLGIASTSANAAGTTTTIVRTGAGWTVDQYKGYTLLFTNGADMGALATVTGNDATTISFSPAAPYATASGMSLTLWPTASGGDIDTAYAAKGVTVPSIDRGVSLVDAGRNWTANQWTGYYLYMQTGKNAGLYRAITGNTATTLTVATANLASGMPFPFLVVAGDRYLILPKEDTSSTSELDKVSASISFSNVHYLPASATLHGRDARIAFESPGNWGNGTLRVAAASSYSAKNLHGVSADRCTSCHDQHTGVVDVHAFTCGRCHFNEDGSPVASMSELEEARQFGFQGDLDGDGTEAGLESEIDGLGAVLLQGIRSYSTVKGGGAICYRADANPYWFKDNGLGGGVAGNGSCEDGESVSANAYGASGASWFTPRLLRTAYDYQYYVKEPGAWAHNPRYAIQFLYDAIKNLNQILPSNLTPSTGGQVGYVCSSATLGRIAMNPDGTCPTGYTRTFAPQRSFSAGHFAGMSNPFRFRDTTVNTAGQVGYPCQRCHAGEKGLEAFLGVSFFSDETASYAAAVAPVQGMECTTCHDPRANDADMKRLRDIGATPAGGVRFPGYLASGTILPAGYTTVLSPSSFAAPGDMICSSCHQSRDINGLALDEYLKGTWSGFDVPGSAFLGTGTAVNNGSGNVRLTGLPLYQAPMAKGTPNNWLYTTSCQAVGRFVTVSGAAYNGTFAITACGNGTADLALAYAGDDAVSWSAWTAGTKNTHDIQSAARVYGGAAHIGYEYAGKTYAGAKQHHGATASCMECHSPIASRHSMETAEVVAVGSCSSCHSGAAYPTWSAPSRGLNTGPGYDGDPLTADLSSELNSFRLGLAASMNAYARAAGVTQAGGNLCWSEASNAFRTEAGNITGRCVSSTTSWSTWDPRLSRAYFNMLLASPGSDPGGPWHNFDYLAQLLYDSAEHLNGGGPVSFVNAGSTYFLTRP
jgi:hypothetical protein